MSQSHILVIDDDPAVRQVLSETLANEGHQVTLVSSGLEGVEAAKDQPVHVVLTDLQMPGIDGLETIDRISKVDSKIIAIVMTGYGTIDCAVRAMKAGAFDFITKPFEPDTVTVVVKKALDVYKLKQENHLLRKPYGTNIGWNIWWGPARRCAWCWISWKKLPTATAPY